MRPFAIPMTTRFRSSDRRVGLLLEGTAGWGEFSPFPEYPAEVATRWAAAAREAAELGWPEPRRRQVPVNCIVPAVAADRAWARVDASACRTAKVKVAEPGQTLTDDLDRCAAVRDALGPTGRLRVDANGAWDVPTAAHALGRLARYDLEYAEQPVAGLEGLAALRRRVDVPLAADEAIRTADDPLRAARLAACDVVVLKVQPLGGVAPAIEVADVVAARGIAVVVSSALETSVGLAAGVALAAALPDLPYACGLATLSLLAGDVVVDPLEPEAGVLPVRRPRVDPALIDRWAPEPVEGEATVARFRAAEAA